MEKSICCKALVNVDSADEGTSCWICTNCGKVCDILQEPVFPADQIIHEVNGPMIGNKPDCKHHLDTILKYSGTLEELAQDIGDLKYDKMEELFAHLESKIRKDAEKDNQAGRYQLGLTLNYMAGNLSELKLNVIRAWRNCKPYMK